MNGPLQGKRILVTRPAAQAGPLAALIEQAGGEAKLFPLITIAPADDLMPLALAIGWLETFSLVIFVSANAVMHSLPHILAWRDWPGATRAVASGPGTAACLATEGIERVLAPQEPFDSESLLALPELQAEQVAARKILILRGNGGRALLAETLRERGADVVCVTCYLRLPPGDPAPLLSLLRNSEVDALVVSSSQSLRNLMAVLDTDACEQLRALPCFVPHRRIAETASRFGLRAVLTGPADAGIIDGLCAYDWQKHG